MKKIYLNKDDSSFNNKYKFSDLMDKMKAMGISVVKNGGQICILGALVGGLSLSALNTYKIVNNVVQEIDDIKISNENKEKIKSVNNEAVDNLLSNNGIFVVNSLNTEQQKYYFDNKLLYDINKNIISLKGTSENIYFIKCSLDDETLKNIDLVNSQTKVLQLDYSSIDDNFVKYLPSSLEQLSIDYCNYVTNLNDLPNKCPNLKILCINCMASLNDLSFIYNLSNLEEIYISNNIYITEELLDYFNSNNIKTNVTNDDIINSKKIDEIIDNIIKPDMNDKEKIQAICTYVLDNMEYDIAQSLQSNQEPLNCALNNGKGVCISYAYLTNILLNKVGIESFAVTNNSHAWNIIKLDNKYYYIDTTNMDGSKIFNFLLKTLNISKYYMVDTENTFFSSMTSSQNNVTIISQSLIKDILSGRSDKDIFEKYGGLVGNIGILIASCLSGILIALGPNFLKEIIEEAPDLLHDIKIDYNIELKNIKNGHLKS